jgi:hypothetical protein
MPAFRRDVLIEVPAIIKEKSGVEKDRRHHQRGITAILNVLAPDGLLSRARCDGRHY